jgi:alanine racemase
MHDHLIWAEIDHEAIAHNVRELRRITHPQARLLVAVKADAYGHGAEMVARTALANGATHLGVARCAEGAALRAAGIKAPILIFGYTPAERAGLLFDLQLTPAVYALQNAHELATAAISRNRNLAVHVKVDTGMGRLGIPCLRPDGIPAAVKEIRAIAALEGIRLEGLFTHFASADEADKRAAHEQFSRFQQLLGQLQAADLPIDLRHAANSGAIIDLPGTHLDMVRAGIAAYGLFPSHQVNRTGIDLRPAMSFKARIIHIKSVPAGTAISYGGTYRTAAAATIATVPAGYGDGYDRGFSNCGTMLVRGRRAPIVGRVCMDLTMLDVSHISEVQVGDEVVIMGRQGKESITADELAALLGTINYEVVTRIMERVPRVHVSAAP